MPCTPKTMLPRPCVNPPPPPPTHTTEQGLRRSPRPCWHREPCKGEEKLCTGGGVTWQGRSCACGADHACGHSAGWMQQWRGLLSVSHSLGMELLVCC